MAAGLGAQAQANVNAQINAALAGDRASTRAAQQQAIRQATRAQGFAKALASMITPRADAVTAAYRGAGDRIRAYGTGLTGALGADQRAEAARSAADVAAGTAGKGVVTGYDLPSLRNVLRYTGMTIPGVSLEEQAMNARGEAQGIGAANASQIGQIADAYRQKTLDLQGQLAGQRTALEAQRPVLYQQALDALRTQAREDAQLSLSRRSTIAGITGIDPATGKPTAAARAAARSTSVTTPRLVGSASGGYYQYNPKTGRWQLVIAPRSTTTLGNVTPATLAGLSSKAGDIAYTAYHGVANSKYTGKNPNQYTNPMWVNRPAPAHEALADMRAKGIPYPVAMRAIVAFARLPNSWWHDEVLGPKGWFPRGYPPPRNESRGPGAR